MKMTFQSCKKHGTVTVQYIMEVSRCHLCIEEQLANAPEELQFEVERLRKFKFVAGTKLVQNNIRISKEELYDG